MTPHINEIKSWFVAEDSAEMGGNSDRTADVTADAEVAEPCSQSRGGAARRPAGGSLNVPRVVRRPIDRVVGLPVGEIDGDVGAADHDRAGAQETVDCLRVLPGFCVGNRDHPPCARISGHREAFLDEDRNAVEDSALRRFALRFVRLRGLCEGLFPQLKNKSVELGIVAVDALEDQSDQLHRGDPLSADGFGSLQGGHEFHGAGIAGTLTCRA